MKLLKKNIKGKKPQKEKLLNYKKKRPKIQAKRPQTQIRYLN